MIVYSCCNINYEIKTGVSPLARRWTRVSLSLSSGCASSQTASQRATPTDTSTSDTTTTLSATEFSDVRIESVTVTPAAVFEGRPHPDVRAKRDRQFLLVRFESTPNTHTDLTENIELLLGNRRTRLCLPFYTSTNPQSRSNFSTHRRKRTESRSRSGTLVKFRGSYLPTSGDGSPIPTPRDSFRSASRTPSPLTNAFERTSSSPTRVSRVALLPSSRAVQNTNSSENPLRAIPDSGSRPASSRRRDLPTPSRSTTGTKLSQER